GHGPEHHADPVAQLLLADGQPEHLRQLSRSRARPAARNGAPMRQNARPCAPGPGPDIFEQPRGSTFQELWVQYQLSKVVAGPLLHLFWRPRITGLEYIPPEGGAILASNHLSIVDSIFLPLMLDRPLTFAAKSEYFTGRGVG